MKILSWLFLAVILACLFWAAGTSPHHTYDNQVSAENAKALLHMDDHLYDFQSWRPMGHNLLYLALAALAGEERMPLLIHLASVAALALSALAFFLAVREIHGGATALIALTLMATLRPLLHWGPVGVSDMFALLPHALALLILARPPSRWSSLLLVLLTVAAGSLRPTYIPLIPLMAWAWRPSWRSCVSWASKGLVAGVLCTGLHLVVLVALRGREYGWHTLVSAYAGSSKWHLSDQVHDPWSHLAWLLLEGPGPLVPLLGVAGLLRFWREAWARPLVLLCLWIVFVHVIMVRAFELRYLMILSMPLCWAAAHLLFSMTRGRTLVVLVLAATQIPLMALEIRHHVAASARPFLAERILGILAEWEPRKHRVFWRGQFFTTLTDEVPAPRGDRSWNIVSLATASFNFVSDFRVTHLHPERPMKWEFLEPTRGWVEPDVAQGALDGDILILSAAKTCYMMGNLPPIMSPEALALWDPSKDTDTLVQNPLILERLRRERLTPVGEGIWKAGPLLLKGHPETRLEGAPFAHRAVLLRPGTWDLVWVDRLQIVDRNGRRYMDASGALLQEEHP